MKLTRPDRRLAPAAFYRDYVPQLWRELTAGGELPKWRFDLVFAVDGAAHVLRYEAGALVTAEAASAPVLTVRCDEAAWRLGSIELLPQIFKRIEPRLEAVRAGLARFTTSVDPARLCELPGVLVIEYTDDAGDEGAYRCEIGSGRGPEAILRARDQDLWALLAARGRLSDLLKSRCEIDGDAGYLLRLARFFE